jgi:hypothetical protein
MRTHIGPHKHAFWRALHGDAGGENRRLSVKLVPLPTRLYFFSLILYGS